MRASSMIDAVVQARLRRPRYHAIPAIAIQKTRFCRINRRKVMKLQQEGEREDGDSSWFSGILRKMPDLRGNACPGCYGLRSVAIYPVPGAARFAQKRCLELSGAQTPTFIETGEFQTPFLGKAASA